MSAASDASSTGGSGCASAVSSGHKQRPATRQSCQPQSLQKGRWVDAPPGAPFDGASRYHLLINLAVGGHWAGQANHTGIDLDAYPQTLLVDHVRVYRCESARGDGSGCATRGEGARLVILGERGTAGP